MSLDTVCVKTEAEEVHVKEEAEEECDSEEPGVHVKEEAQCEDRADLCDLYAGHQIKGELVLGPEELHRPCVPFPLPVAANRAEEDRGRACSVRLERLLVDAERRSCRLGLHTYTLRRTREPRHYTDTLSAAYQCDECGKEFRNKSALRKHIHTHLSELSTCFKKLALPVAANRAEEDRGRACSVRLERLLVDAERRSCRLGLHTYTLRRTREPRHYTDTLSAAYQCDECGKEFRNKSALRKHIHTHLSELSTCFKKLALPATLARVKEARGRTRSGRRERRLVGAQQVHVGGKRFKCSDCDYECHWKSHLRIHQSKHIGEKPFKCSHCDYKSKQKAHLVSHERIHTDDKPFKCSYCDYKCRYKASLQNHERIHTGENPFKCSYCDYKCRYKAGLQSHERIHTGETPFKCSYCNYKCRLKSTLKSHERIHTGESPFKCSYCDYKCRYKSYLKIHERIHTGENPFKCSYCDYKCTYKSYLKIHERIHTGENPFKCSYCDYKCRHSSTLKIHERIHTGKNPFKCSYCDRRCRQKSSLNIHEMIHTGEKPFKCSYCDYKCRHKSSLKSHETTHTHDRKHSV